MRNVLVSERMRHALLRIIARLPFDGQMTRLQAEQAIADAMHLLDLVDEVETLETRLTRPTRRERQARQPHWRALRAMRAVMARLRRRVAISGI